MNKIIYINNWLFVCLSLFTSSNKDSVKTRHEITDTIKIVYDQGPFPMEINLKLKYYNKFYAHPKTDVEEHYRPIRLDILHFAIANNSKLHSNNNTNDKFKILYSFSAKDTSALSAIFSTVKYDGDYYIIAFPHGEEWFGFTPPQKKDGSFLYTPIALLLDTVKWSLTRMKYNDKLKINYSKSVYAEKYYSNRDGHQFDRLFAFSKVRNEFAFGIPQKKYLRN
ncbi:MAG: hypothetical protein JWR09_592 [Mucilaginibacter sp.]|nr:hypothetical protein [Mucilaginibacter sp.]